MCFQNLLFKKKHENACENDSQTSKTYGLFRKTQALRTCSMKFSSFSLLFGLFESKQPQNGHFFENGCSADVFPVPLRPGQSKKQTNKKLHAVKELPGLFDWHFCNRSSWLVQKRKCAGSTKLKESFLQQTIFFCKNSGGKTSSTRLLFSKQFDRKKET